MQYCSVKSRLKVLHNVALQLKSAVLDTLPHYARNMVVHMLLSSGVFGPRRTHLQKGGGRLG